MDAHPVSYSLQVNNTWKYVLLIGFCILLCPVIFLLGLALVAVGIAGSELAIIALVVSGFGIPILIFFLLRKRARDSIKVDLGADFIEVFSPRSNRRASIAEIQSFWSAFDDGEDEKSVTVVVVLTNGLKIRVFASDTLGSIKPLLAFRNDFERWAAQHNLVRKEPWWHRNLFATSKRR